MNLTDSQKKIAGMVIIIGFAMIELLFLGALIFTLVSGGGPPEQSFSFVFVMGIFAVPLWWGIGLWKASVKAGNHVVESVIPQIDDGSVMSVDTKIELPEYRRMVFYNTYTHPMIIFLYFIGISFVVYYFVSGSSDWFVLFVTIFLLYLPISIYRSARSSYESSKTVHERLRYTFSRRGVTVAGETVDFFIQWQSLFKIHETKRWFLLYTNKQNVMLIPKSSFTSELEVARFKEVIPVECIKR